MKNEKKRKKERKKGAMNNVTLLHNFIKGCFFQFFNSPVALMNIKQIGPPQEKVEMTPLSSRDLFAYCSPKAGFKRL